MPVGAKAAAVLALVDVFIWAKLISSGAGDKGKAAILGGMAVKRGLAAVSEEGRRGYG